MKQILIEDTEFWIRDSNRSDFDLDVIEEVFVGDTYCIDPTKHQSVVINVLFQQEFPIVIDVGAHIGSFMKLVKKHREHAKVICIEPCPESFKILQRNAENEDVVLYQAAVRYDKANVFIDGFGATGGGYLCNSCDVLPGLGDSGLFVADSDVRLMSLEDIIQKNKIDQIDLLKLDCEGSEWQILEKCSDETIDKIQCIVGEFHGEPWRFIKLLAKRFLDYKLGLEGYKTIGKFWLVRKTLLEISK